MLRPLSTVALFASLLGACATTEMRGDERPDDLESALMTPAQDVGLSKIEIPRFLADMTDPYALRPANCQDLRSEIATLNDILGEDLDIPEEEAERREQIAINATGETVSAILIPFRGVVRAISGASSNERKAREAYQRGLVRRGYLKGLSVDMNCMLTR